MKKLLLIFILTSLSLFAFGQGNTGEIFLQDTLLLDQVTIKGERPDPYYMEGFLFSAFTLGEVLFKTGSRVQAYLNYDAVFSRMYFIGDNDKHMILGEVERIAMVTIGGRRFIPLKDGSFAELLSYSNGSILKQHRSLFATRGVKNAYGVSDQTMAVQKLKDFSYYDESHLRTNVAKTVERNPDQVTTDRSVYYVYDRKGRPVPVLSLRPLYKIFGHKEEIDAFVKANDLNIKNSDDFIRIMEFCQSLEQQQQ